MACDVELKDDEDHGEPLQSLLGESKHHGAIHPLHKELEDLPRVRCHITHLDAQSTIGKCHHFSRLLVHYVLLGWQYN